MNGWDPLVAGSLIGERYRVVSRLAQSGYSVIYLAEHKDTERRVAIKLLWPHCVDPANALDELRREARIASRVNSQHIVDVFDVGVDTALAAAYLVMEYLPGSDLQQLVDQTGPLGRARAVEYLRQVAVGLDKAHAHVDRKGRRAPIVHRDLKPANLFVVEREDGTPLVKILDFGLAKALSQSVRLSLEVKGTPAYMAFEQAVGRAVTPAADIWALGLVTFFLLTGRCYWRCASGTHGDHAALFAEVINQPMMPPSHRAAELGIAWDLPAQFDGWFFRCVNRNESRRFPSAGEAVRALAAALGVGRSGVDAPRAAARERASSPVATRPPDEPGSAPPVAAPIPRIEEHAAVGPPASRAVGRDRARWVSAGVAGLLLGGAALAIWWPKTRDRASAADSSTSAVGPAARAFVPSAPVASARPAGVASAAASAAPGSPEGAVDAGGMSAPDSGNPKPPGAHSPNHVSTTWAGQARPRIKRNPYDDP